MVVSLARNKNDKGNNVIGKRIGKQSGRSDAPLARSLEESRSLTDESPVA
jgi:hypothetical protein